MVVKEMFGSVKGKKITVLGFAFKGDTSDTRDSPAIDVCKHLTNEGYFITLWYFS